jgi:hypothetical protein
MWRTLFALVHADGYVTEEEVHYMAEVLEDIPFSEEQSAILREDINTAQDAIEMFGRVTDVMDQAEFFKFAREIVHADGDYGSSEQNLIMELQRVHMKQGAIDEMIGHVDLSFDDDSSSDMSVAGKGDDSGASVAARFKNFFRKK